MELVIAACVLMALIAGYSAFIIIRQQKMIDKLNDRLMAKDYREYKRSEPVPVNVRTDDDDEDMSNSALAGTKWFNQ